MAAANANNDMVLLLLLFSPLQEVSSGLTVGVGNTWLLVSVVSAYMYNM